MARLRGGGEAVIILNISIKGEQLFEGDDVIEGRLIFEEIRHSRKTLHELSNIFVIQTASIFPPH